MLPFFFPSVPQALDAHSRELPEVLVERIGFYTEGLQGVVGGRGRKSRLYQPEKPLASFCLDRPGCL